MANIVKWIEEKLEEDEVIEGVVIGEGDRIDDYSTSILLDSILEKKRKIYDKVIPWVIAKPLLDYEFDSGFGTQDCNTVYIWTNKNVLFINEYDGSTCLSKIPRNPIDCIPKWNGE